MVDWTVILILSVVANPSRVLTKPVEHLFHVERWLHTNSLLVCSAVLTPSPMRKGPMEMNKIRAMSVLVAATSSTTSNTTANFVQPTVLIHRAKSPQRTTECQPTLRYVRTLSCHPTLLDKASMHTKGTVPMSLYHVSTLLWDALTSPHVVR